MGVTHFRPQKQDKLSTSSHSVVDQTSSKRSLRSTKPSEAEASTHCTRNKSIARHGAATSSAFGRGIRSGSTCVGRISSTFPLNGRRVPTKAMVGLEEVRRQWGGTTMFKRLEKECRVFFQQPIDGLVFVLPREMSDVDGSLLASAAHPEIVQSAKWRAPESGRLQTHSSINSCTSIGTPSSKHRGSGDVLTAVRGANSSPPSALLSGFENGALEYSMSFPGGLQWLIAVRCAAGSIYEGSVFLLRLRFTARYPIESPEVVFIPPYVPVHPHVYSNGHICLSILYDAWSPALSAETIGVSIQSMLSSNTVRIAPPDDKQYCALVGSKSPKGVCWYFHDDAV